MYTNLSAQSLSVRMSYSDYQTSKARTAQVSEKAENSESASAEKTEKSANFTDILSLATKDSGPITNIQAYVQDSVNKVMEKIAEHASKVLSGQSISYSVSYTSISITIEMDEGQSLEDVKAELDKQLSSDGYWGVDQTSQRMFDFAVAYTGDNPEELAKAKDAVTKGFKQTEAMFGGNLPQISYDTYDATMNKFDNYIQQINNSLTSTYA